MNGKEISRVGYQNNWLSGIVVCSDDTTDHNFSLITTANPDISFS